MTRYRKKPVVVDAMQFTDCDEHTAYDVYCWAADHVGTFQPYGDPPSQGVSIDPATGTMLIATLEGVMTVKLGDWIIRGVKGEFYPCKPGIFDETYEVAE